MRRQPNKEAYLQGEFDYKILNGSGDVPHFESTPVAMPHSRKPDNQTEAVRSLATIWARTLGISTENIDHDRSFIHHGGQSLLVTQLHSELNQQFEEEVPLEWLFTKSLSDLAASLASCTQSSGSVLGPGLSVRETDDSFPLSSGQLRLWAMQQAAPRSSMYNEYVALKLVGPLSLNRLEASLAWVMRDTRFCALLSKCLTMGP